MIQSLPKVPDLKETALLALGLVQHQLLCGKGIPLNPYSLSVRQKLLFQFQSSSLDSSFPTPPPPQSPCQPFRNAVDTDEVNPTALGDIRKH